MSILAKVAVALQSVFGTVVAEAAASSRVIQRQRKFNALTLAQTFLFGYWNKPTASDEELAQMAIAAGAVVTPQAIEQRHTPRLVAFLQALFHGVIKQSVPADQALAPLLERFTEVTLLDSSTVTLPDSLKEQYPGCGGGHGHGGGRAALKLQTELNLRTGALHLEVEAGRHADNASARQHAARPKGSLRIADLGYFALPVLAAMTVAQTFFLSRLLFGTKVVPPERTLAQPSAALLRWLATQTGPFVDVAIRLGQAERLGCRLIAWRVPTEQANQRRYKLRQELRQKKGREPSAARLAWCDWSILVTNVPVALLSPKEAVVLYRARWQIELLFKRWKSLDLVATLSGSTDVRQMVRVWGRLTAAVLQHWVLVASTWNNATRSWVKTSKAIRGFVRQLLGALGVVADLVKVLVLLCQVVAKTCGRNKRSKPGTIELLQNPDLLEYSLT